MARRAIAAQQRKKTQRPRRKNANGPKTGQVAALRKEVAALRTGMRSLRVAGSSQQTGHRAKLAAFARYARVIADPFSAPLVPAPAITQDIFGRNLQITSGLSLRRVFLTTVTVPAGEEAQFAIPLTAHTGHGAIRRVSRNISTGTWSAAAHFNTAANIEPFAADARVRLVAGQLKLTCLNRADELGGTIRFFPVVNHHTTDTIGADPSGTGLSPPFHTPPGTAGVSGSNNTAQAVHAPVAYRNDARRHVLTICPHLSWHEADSMTDWIGAASTTIPAAWDLWSVSNAHEGQPVGLFMITNPTAVALSFEIESASVIEVFHHSVQNSMSHHPVVADTAECMDALCQNLSMPRAGMAHTIDVVEAGLGRATSVSRKGAEAVMAMFGLAQVANAAYKALRGAVPRNGLPRSFIENGL